MEFTDLGPRTGAGQIETAENDMAHIMGGPEIAQHALDHAFRGAMGVDRMLLAILAQHHIVLIAVGRAGSR
jgi:hypothetical protein